MSSKLRKAQIKAPGYKMFIGGLEPQTTSAELRVYFERYGEITWLQVIGEKQKNPRGYGFLKFKEKQSLTSCLQQTHMISGREIDCRIANSDSTKTSQNPKDKPDMIAPPEKVFVHNIPKDSTKQELREHFSQIGEVAEVLLIIRKNKAKAFAYVTFKETGLAQKALKNLRKFKGRALSCQLAQPKRRKDSNTQQNAPISSPLASKEKKRLDQNSKNLEKEGNEPDHSKENLRFNTQDRKIGLAKVWSFPAPITNNYNVLRSGEHTLHIRSVHPMPIV